MIEDLLVSLRDQLDAHLAAVVGAWPSDSREPLVVLVDGDQSDPIEFKLNAISALLVNLEVDTPERPDDPYQPTVAPGTSATVSPPPPPLNLYVLFAARFRQYDQGLTLLFEVIGYLQQHRVLDYRNTPELNPLMIDKVVLEPVTLSFSEVSEVWSALRTAYLPSVVYRLQVVPVEAEQATALPILAEVEGRLTRFAKIFAVSLRHDYWLDGRCRAFHVEPTAETQRFAGNHRLVFRRRPDGIDVAGPVDAAGGLVAPWDGDASFTFELQLHDPGLSSYTAALPAHPHFANSGNDAELVLAAGLEGSEGVFGTVDIRLRSPSSPVAARVFNAIFPVRSIHWAYYCVTNFRDSWKLAMHSTDEPWFGFGRDLADDPDPADPVAVALAWDHPGHRRLRFVTKEAVPARRRGRRVELALGGQPVPGLLANPHPAHQTMVTLASGQTPALYEIIEFFPRFES